MNLTQTAKEPHTDNKNDIEYVAPGFYKNVHTIYFYEVFEGDELYVSTDLCTTYPPSPIFEGAKYVIPENPTHIIEQGRVYRQMDLEFYAYLRKQMDKAKIKFNQGELPENDWEELRTRFNKIHIWMTKKYNKSQILEAARQFRPTHGYLFPASINPGPLNEEPRGWPKTNEPVLKKDTVSTHVYPPNKGGGKFKHLKHVSEDALEKVQAIEEQAKEIGWTHEDLFQNCGRFSPPFGQDYGLICFIRGREITRVTENYIEITNVDDLKQASTRFYRCNRKK
jgi:hypothetical protein